MKLIFMCLVLLGGILAFLYLCKKMGIDVNAVLIAICDKPNSQQVQPVEQVQPLAKAYSIEYESFAYIVWRCLRAVWRVCGLECPDTVSGIYCAKTADRVRCLNGQMIFLYEVPVMNTTAVRNGKIDTKEIDAQKIIESLTENLSDYLDGGYLYSGNIRVWPIDHNRVRIEIHGVGRNNCISGGDIII